MCKHQEFCCGCDYDDITSMSYRLACDDCELIGDEPTYYTTLDQEIYEVRDLEET